MNHAAGSAPGPRSCLQQAETCMANPPRDGSRRRGERPPAGWKFCERNSVSMLRWPPEGGQASLWNSVQKFQNSHSWHTSETIVPDGESRWFWGRFRARKPPPIAPSFEERRVARPVRLRRMRRDSPAIVPTEPQNSRKRFSKEGRKPGIQESEVQGTEG